MARYYYLLASFPDPALPATLKNTSIEEVKETIERNLSDQDKGLFNYLLYPKDCHNLLQVLFNEQEENFHFPAALELPFLKKTKANRYDFPAFIQKFLEKPEVTQLLNGEKEASNYSKAAATKDLLSFFYEEIKGINQKFIRQYFSFDHTIRNLLAALNSRVYPFNKKWQILEGEPYTQEIRQSNDENFGLSGIFEHLPKWNEYMVNNQKEKLEKAVDQARIEHIDTLLKGDAFTSSHVFGYYIKFELYARWQPLTTEKGKKKLKTLIDTYTQKAMEIPEKELAIS